MHDEIIERLSSYRRREVSAAETYRMAIDRVTSPSAREDLARCLDSHEERADRLSARIVELGGWPPDKSGVWGALAKLLQGGADIFGDRAAVGALEEGEDRLRDEYRKSVDELEDSSEVELRAFTERLLVEQLETHRVMSHLQKSYGEDTGEARPSG